MKNRSKALVSTAIGGLLATGLLAGTAVQAQTTRLVVGYAAGGPVDQAARQFAPIFAQHLGHTVVVENRTGAAGTLAGEAVARSTADGSILYFGASPTLTISPFVLKSMTFDPAKDLTPLAPVLSYANALVINNDLPITSIAELVAYAKEHPTKLAYGSAGMGASNHLSGALFAQQAGIDLMHVPYRGNAPAMVDVMGGQVAMMFDIVSTARSFSEPGRVRALAVTSAQRNPSMPDVPTMREAGLPDYEVVGWYGLYGPAGMPAPAAARLHEATAKTLQDEGLRAAWKALGYEIWEGSAANLASKQRSDFALWRGVTKDMRFE